MAKATKQSFIRLFAKDFEIAWGDDKRYWKWENLLGSHEGTVAELIEVCFLEIKTKFDTSDLQPGTKYELSFRIMMKDNAAGFTHPVKLGFEIPNVIEEEREEDFSEVGPKDKWIDVPVGQFTAPHNAGQMEMHLSGTESLVWKKGMVFAGAVIRSKN